MAIASDKLFQFPSVSLQRLQEQFFETIKNNLTQLKIDNYTIPRKRKVDIME